MTLELAMRTTEVLLAWALLQASLEHLATGDHRLLFGTRALLCLLLAAGVAPALSASALWLTSLALLWRFDGPYNGGSDKMGILILTALTIAHLGPALAEVALAYLGVQLILSYAVSGWVKIKDPDWRSGAALADVFTLSAYPQSQQIRRLGQRPSLVLMGSWAVMTFEVLFPLALLSSPALIAALVIAALFHLANALLFGLNRFLWHWLAAFPALIWLQDRLIG